MKDEMSTSATRVFISNLPEPYSEEELTELFGTSGDIVDVAVKWTMGFVEFESVESANKAVKDLNKTTVGDQTINVMLAALANTLTTVSASAVSSSAKSPISSRLFIGNLDEKTTRADLEAIFAPFGAVNSCEVKKSYGFVRMETLEAAVAARQALDRQKDQNNGKPLRIDFAEPRRKAKLFIGNMASGTTPEQVKEAFSKFGIVLDTSVMGNFGFVTFDDDQDAQKAVAGLHHTSLNGSKIKVEVSTSDSKTGGDIGREPAAKRSRGGRHRAASPVDYLPPRYADAYGRDFGRDFDPYGRTDPYARADPYADSDPYGRDPYGYPPRAAVTYPGYGRPVSSAYDLSYDRPSDGRRKPLMDVGARPLKRRR